jgi:hypothetical protein
MFVMAGLVPAIHAFLSNQRWVQIIPFAIEPANQANLPSARPMFHGLFSLNGEADVVVLFVVDEKFKSVCF